MSELMTENARRWPLLRTLRSVASVGCFTLCVALVLLWVRSYWKRDSVSDPRGGWSACSWRGTIEFLYYSGIGSEGSFRYESISPRDFGRHVQGLVPLIKPQYSRFGFGYENFGNEAMAVEGVVVQVPCWFLVVMTAAASVALKPKPRYRFSLLDFLALTTFAAMLAALVAKIKGLGFPLTTRVLVSSPLPRPLSVEERGAEENQRFALGCRRSRMGLKQCDHRLFEV